MTPIIIIIVFIIMAFVLYYDLKKYLLQINTILSNFPQKAAQHFLTLIIGNVSPNQHIRMISEGSWDTENPALHYNN